MGLNEYKGHCRCQLTGLTFSTAQPLYQFTPRACDCDYCMADDVAYMSDPHGELTISARIPLIEEKQGSEQATFLRCSGCHQVVAACHVSDKGMIGAFNSRMLDDKSELQPAEPSSPKQLPAEKKLKRWRLIWMPVTVQQHY